ncbi:MAG: hypothetical protein M0R38_01835 [Bacteroidia bacterium]|nr:hypothetical protein [Bacteroidia bacterium]
MKSIKPFLLLFAILGVFDATAQKSTVVSQGEFYRKTAFGIEKTVDYYSGDSTFMLELTLNNMDSFNLLTVSWYLQGYEGSMNQLIDTAAFGIKNVQRKFAVSFTRKSFAFPVGFYFVNIYLDGKFQERYAFRVLSEPVLSGQFLLPQDNKLIPVNAWQGIHSNLVLRVIYDRMEVPDSSMLETVWFFVMDGDEPLYLDEVKYMIVGDYNYVDFPLNLSSEIPKGLLVAEIWINGNFQKYYRIEVK